MDFISKSTSVSIYHLSIYLYLSSLLFSIYINLSPIYIYLYLLYLSTRPPIDYFSILILSVFCVFPNQSHGTNSYLCSYFDSKRTTHEHGRPQCRGGGRQAAMRCDSEVFT